MTEYANNMRLKDDMIEELKMKLSDEGERLKRVQTLRGVGKHQLRMNYLGGEVSSAMSMSMLANG